MTIAIAGLLAGFILILLLLAFLVLKTQLGVVNKLIAVILVTVFYWVQYESLLKYSGWPTTDQLPEEFILIATDVHEPNPRMGNKGVMYWWVRESGKIDYPPRVYQLPYRAEMHQQTEQVVKEQKQGAQYVGKTRSSSLLSEDLGVEFEKISKASRHKKE